MTSLRGLERQEFPQSVRKAAFKRCCRNGEPHCESCGKVLRAGNIIYEHIDPDGLGGEPILENCKVHCRTCATEKTIKEDNPRMQKADRNLKKNYGLMRKRRTIPGRKFDGTPIQARWVNR